MINPLTKKLFDAIEKYVVPYVSGECSYEDAIDLVFSEVNEYTESEEFYEEVKYYFKNFVDIKKIREEEIKWSI